jgi:hypothetical protein
VVVAECSTSVITSKAAIGYHFKTGHSTNVRDRCFTPSVVIKATTVWKPSIRMPVA